MTREHGKGQRTQMTRTTRTVSGRRLPVLACALVNDSSLRHGPVSVSGSNRWARTCTGPNASSRSRRRPLRAGLAGWRHVHRGRRTHRRRGWSRATENMRPNGIAMLPDGSFLLANLGVDGGVWRLHRDGHLVRSSPRSRARSPAGELRDRGRHSVASGSRSALDELRGTTRGARTSRTASSSWSTTRGARIVADGLHYTNEVRPDPSGTWLYVVETFGRRLMRFRSRDDGGAGRTRDDRDVWTRIAFPMDSRSTQREGSGSRASSAIGWCVSWQHDRDRARRRQ